MRKSKPALWIILVGLVAGSATAIVPVKHRAENDVGYVQITDFNEQTTIDLQKAVRSLNRQIGAKLKGYVIDLRNDPGGLLDQAIGVADAFLDVRLVPIADVVIL